MQDWNNLCVTRLAIAPNIQLDYNEAHGPVQEGAFCIHERPE
jgi:hypothetical protein